MKHGTHSSQKLRLQRQRVGESSGTAATVALGLAAALGETTAEDTLGGASGAGAAMSPTC